MAPLIAALLNAGLPLLGNAVIGKGVEWVKEKTGLDLDMDRAPSESQLAALKTVQEERKEELEAYRAESDRLGAYLADVQDARKREIEIANSANAPTLNKVITPVLALIVVIGGGVILQINPDAEVKYAVVSIMMLVLGYYFGTSQGSTKANQMFRDMVRKG